MKHTVILICPYFGTINKSIHSLWLLGCAANPDITFLLLTDDAEVLEMPMPENVRGVFMTWEACVWLIQQTFVFDVSIQSPYKLCDYRPAYGEIFQEFISDYEFWGHTDSGDTLYGDLKQFLTNEMLDSYDKIHVFGHLTLYRNTPENNQRYLCPESSGIDARTVFTTEENLCFDDMFQRASINRIYQENGFSLLERVPDLVADLFPSKWAFQIVEDQGEKIPRVFEWDHGKLFDVTVRNDRLHRREIGYVHFQKRKMENRSSGADHFYLIPNEIIPADFPLTAEYIRRQSREKIYLAPTIGRIKRVVNYAKNPEVFRRKLKDRFTR